MQTKNLHHIRYSAQKGTSYSVKGSEIKEYMHIDVEELMDKYLKK